MDSKSELKPCPFCGKVHSVQLVPNDEADWIADDARDGDGFYIICSFIEGGCGTASGWAESEAVAIARWNKRVEV